MMAWGLVGPETYRFYWLNWKVLSKFSDPAVFMRSWSVSRIINAIKDKDEVRLPTYSRLVFWNSELHPNRRILKVR